MTCWPLESPGPLDAARPLVCFDAGSKDLHGEARMSRSVIPGHPARVATEEVRHGTANRFLWSASGAPPCRGNGGDVRVPAVDRIVLVLATEAATRVATPDAARNAVRNATRVTVHGPFLSAGERTTLTHRSPVLLSGL